MSETTTRQCPECGHGNYLPNVTGIRVCPQCGCLLKLTRAGVEVKRAAQLRRDGASATFKRAREYRVVHVDGTVLCAACSLPTLVSAALDGKARHLRGFFCPPCTIKLGAVPVGRMAVDTRPLSVKSPNWNTRAQRLAAEDGIVAAFNAMRNGADDPNSATALVGANWAHTGDAVEYARAHTDIYHPRYCDCAACMRRAENATFDPAAHIDACRYIGPAEAGTRWTGRLPRLLQLSPAGRYVVSVTELRPMRAPVVDPPRAARKTWTRTRPLDVVPGVGAFLRLPACRARL